jgi:signal transduction histidine kinase
VILAQADSAQYMDDSDVARIRAALANISTSARQSLGDVRQVLSTTGERESAAPRAAGGLDGLIDGVRSAGYDMRTADVGTPRPLPPELDAVAFRVLQEMLTNALKHGSRGPITVIREWGDDHLRIEVKNGMPADSAPELEGGLGLGGMAHRLATVGGRLTAGPSGASDGSPVFVAVASVPLRDQGGRR